MDNGEEALKHVDEDSIDILPDFPPGPLDNYRKQATFPWKKLRLFVEDEELLKFKVILFDSVWCDPYLLNLNICGPISSPYGKPWKQILFSTNQVIL
jgi:hypothetical protein